MRASQSRTESPADIRTKIPTTTHHTETEPLQAVWPAAITPERRANTTVSASASAIRLARSSRTLNSILSLIADCHWQGHQLLRSEAIGLERRIPQRGLSPFRGPRGAP